MPRFSRVVLAGCAHHVVHRGHNRQQVFFEDRDFQRYLDTLRTLKKEIGLEIYAYCLMSNHVHLLVNPGEDPANLSRLMHRLAGRYAGYFNKNLERTGACWEGRFKSSPVQSDDHLLHCGRYIDLNPVRAGLAELPELYPWSSYRARAGLIYVPWIDEDDVYRSLGRTPSERQAWYRNWCEQAVLEPYLERIREAVERGELTGSEAFIDEIEKLLGHSVRRRRRGRPRVLDS